MENNIVTATMLRNSYTITLFFFCFQCCNDGAGALCKFTRFPARRNCDKSVVVLGETSHCGKHQNGFRTRKKLDKLKATFV